MINIFYKNNKLVFIILFFILFIFVDQNFTKKNSSILSWDEVDYANSASLGVLENSFEFKSLNFYQFINLGLFKLSNINSKVSKLESVDILNNLETDIFNLRHFHPPLYSYYLSMFIFDQDNLINAKNLRAAHKYLGYLYPLFLLLSFYFINKNTNISLLKYFLIFVLSLIFFYSKLFQDNLLNLNYHTLFAICLLLYSYTLYKYLIKGTFKNLIRFSFSTSIILISLETAIVIIIPCLLFIFLQILKYKKSFYNFKYIVIFIFLFFIIFWPANIYNFSILKSYLMYIYRIFINENIEYSDLNNIIFFKNIFFNNIEIFIIFFFYLFIFFLFFKNYKINHLLFFLNALIYFIFIINFSHHTNYLIPSFILFSFFVILIVSNNKLPILNNKIIKNTSLLFFFIFLLKNIYYNVPTSIIENNDLQEIKLINNYIKNNSDENEIIIADGAHIFNYYQNTYQYINLSLFDKYNPKFYVKVDNIFYDTEFLLQKKLISFLIINKIRNYKLDQYEFLISNGYEKKEFPNYYIFKKVNNS